MRVGLGVLYIGDLFRWEGMLWVIRRDILAAQRDHDIAFSIPSLFKISVTTNKKKTVAC